MRNGCDLPIVARNERAMPDLWARIRARRSGLLYGGDVRQLRDLHTTDRIADSVGIFFSPWLVAVPAGASRLGALLALDTGHLAIFKSHLDSLRPLAGPLKSTTHRGRYGTIR